MARPSQMNFLHRIASTAQIGESVPRFFHAVFVPKATDLLHLSQHAWNLVDCTVLHHYTFVAWYCVLIDVLVDTSETMCLRTLQVCICVHCVHRVEQYNVAPGIKHCRHQDLYMRMCVQNSEAPTEAAEASAGGSEANCEALQYKLHWRLSDVSEAGHVCSEHTHQGGRYTNPRSRNAAAQAQSSSQYGHYTRCVPA